VVSARIANFRRDGWITFEEGGRSLTNRTIYKWTYVEKRLKSKKVQKRAAPKPSISVSPHQPIQSSLDALMDSLAEGMVASLVAKVKARLPAALASVAPASHLQQAVALPPPEVKEAPKQARPLIGVVGLLPQQNGALQARLGNALDLRFWNDGENKAGLKAIADNCEVVFLHTRHAGHHTDQLLKTYCSNLRRVTGGTTNMETSIRAYLNSKETV
jgi:hypothetical protein